MLPAVNERLEALYLRLQDDLETLSASSSQMISDARDLIAASARANIAEILESLQSPTAFLDENIREGPVLASQLSAALESVSDTLSIEARLRRNLAPLRFMQVMFRVESAALPEDFRDTFVSLAAEIGALYARVEENCSAQFSALRQVKTSLGEAVLAMERHHREFAAKLAARRRDLEATLLQIAGEVAANQRRNAELKAAADTFAAAVNAAIMAMQTQDIVAQRMEHAALGLREAISAVGTAESDRAVETLGKVPALARIEVAQIDAVIAELIRSQQSLQGAFSSVAERVGTDGAESALVEEFRRSAGSIRSVVRGLLESKHALTEMIGETQRLSVRCEQTLRPAEAALQELKGSIGEIARTMRRIGLNAQIRAVQTGTQTGLEVLASRTAEIAQQTLSISTTLTSGLTTTSDLLQSAADRFRKNIAAGQSAFDFCTSAASFDDVELHGFLDETTARTERFEELVQDARKIASAIVPGIDIRETLAELNRVRESVEALAEAAEDLPLDLASVDSIERRYTMSSEREVHHRVLREMGAETTGEHKEEDLASNVELF